MPSLSKLIVERLPYLKKGVKLELKDYAIWRLRLGRWARGNSLQDYIIGPLPGVPDPDKVQDGKRYILHAIEDESLSGDLADNFAILTGPDAWAWIGDNWLAGQSEADILRFEFDKICYTDGQSINAFLADFWLIISHLDPPPTSNQACDHFAERVPREFDVFLRLANSDPGRQSVAPAENDVERAL